MERAEAAGRGALGRWGARRGGEGRAERAGLSGWGGGSKGGMGREVKLGIKHGAVGTRHGAAMGRQATTVGSDWAAARGMGGATSVGRMWDGVAKWGTVGRRHGLLAWARWSGRAGDG